MIIAMKNTNILIFPGGTENGLEVYRSLNYQKRLKLYGAANSKDDNTFFYYENAVLLPDVKHEKQCLNELNSFIKKNTIQAIFPANSVVIDFLVKNRHVINCKILMSNNDSILLTRNKLTTYQFFKNHSFIAKYNFENIDSKDLPLFCKPKSSYGSKGCKILYNKIEVEKIQQDSNFVIQEYLSGEEITVECFSTIQNELIYSCARTRGRIRMGTSLLSREITDHNELIRIKEIANSINQEIKIEGLWFFQLKKNRKGEYKLLEIELRVPGSLAFSRSKGVNLPYLQLLQILMGYSLKLAKSKIHFEQSRNLDLVYRILKPLKFNKIFIDLDDTLIIRNKINYELMAFIYKQISNNKKIILITKSLSKNLKKDLVDMKILQIFDEIIHLKEEDQKHEYMSPGDIYIDDSFSQRLLAEQKGIHSFGPEQIEILNAL